MSLAPSNTTGVVKDRLPYWTVQCSTNKPVLRSLPTQTKLLPHMQNTVPRANYVCTRLPGVATLELKVGVKIRDNKNIATHV